MAQTTSELWKTLWQTKHTTIQYAFDINSVWYGPDEDAEVEHAADSKLYQEPGIGNAESATLALSLFADSIPKGATIKRYIRLKNGDQVSEWLPKGVFYTNRRYEDEGYWTLETYDALRKAEKKYLAEGDTGEWPRSMQTVVNDIAARIGVTIDSRTVINPDYMQIYPNDYTMRELLRQIAAAHGGNWIMTDIGELRLVPFASIPAETNYLVTEKGIPISVGGINILIDDETGTTSGTADAHYVGFDVESLEATGVYKPVSRVTLMWDDEHYYTAGDDTGMEIIAECPSATQEMVDNILAAINGYEYKAYNAGAVNIDPAAELGDAVTVGDMYSVIAGIADDGMGYPDISAPGEVELEEEYPVEGNTTKELKRRVKLGTSYYGTKITRTEGLVIEKTDGEKVSAKAVFNAEELSFYDANNDQVLYFDPTTGTYKFKGELNVSDKFVVKANGDVDMYGNVTIGGNLRITGTTNWIQVKYAVQQDAAWPDEWFDEWHTVWKNDRVWARYSYDGGNTWSEAIQVQGVDGEQGLPGSDAVLPEWVEEYTKNAEFDTLVTDEWVISMNLYGSKIFGGEIYGGAYFDDDGIGKLTLSYDGEAYLSFETTTRGAARELFAVSGSDNGDETDVAFMTFADKTIFQMYSSDGVICLTRRVDITSPLLSALEDDTVIAKLQEVLGL